MVDRSKPQDRDVVYVPPERVETLTVARWHDVPAALRSRRHRHGVDAYRIEVAEGRRGPWVLGAKRLHELAEWTRLGGGSRRLLSHLRRIAAAVPVTAGVLPRRPAYDDAGGVWVRREELPGTANVRRGQRRKSALPRRLRGRAGETLRDAGDRSLRRLEDLRYDRVDEDLDVALERVPLPAPAPAAPPPTEDRALRRVPHIELDADPPLAPSQAFSFDVFCDDRPASPGQRVTPVDIELPRGVDEVVVEVWVDGAPHVTIEGPSRRLLLLRRDVALSERLTFAARVVDDPPPGGAAVRAVFEYEGRPRGRVEAPIALRRDDEEPPVPASPNGSARRDPVVRVTQGDRRADVTVVVLKTGMVGQYTVRVTAPGVDGWEQRDAEPWPLGTDAAALVAEHLEAFAEAELTPSERRSRLEGAGMEFWSAIPQSFAELYWKLADEGQEIRTLLVASQEPAFPWELAVPHRGRGAHRQVHDPLGVTVAIGRYLDDALVSPEQDLVLDHSWVLAPRYRDGSLPNAILEAEFVRASFGGELIDPSSFDGIETAFGLRAVPLFHLACHGATEPGIHQAVVLDDDVRLLSTQISAMPKLAEAVAAREPLVFVNACEVGRLTPDLLGVGGFAVRFLELGARCVVAPLWKVEDTVAHHFAMAFYGRLSADPPEPPAVIVQELRARAYADGGADSWAAYAFFGDPRAERRA